MALRHQAEPRQHDDRAVEGARVHREREAHRRQPGADDQHGLAGPQAGGRPAAQESWNPVPASGWLQGRLPLALTTAAADNSRLPAQAGRHPFGLRTKPRMSSAQRRPRPPDWVISS